MHGLYKTSLADIARHARVPIGNVYYYFKTKEDLAIAAIASRKDTFDSAYIKLGEAFDDPRQRLVEATQYFSHVREDYAKNGCPSCVIIMSGDVREDPVVKAAVAIFSDFVDWAESQFAQLGHDKDSARKLAITLLSGIQGAIILAKALADANIISTEIERLVQWLNQIPNKKVRIGKVSLISEPG